MHLSYAGEEPLVMSGESARQGNIQYKMNTRADLQHHKCCYHASACSLLFCLAIQP